MGDVEFDLGYTPDGGAVDNFVKFMVWEAQSKRGVWGSLGQRIGRRHAGKMSF